MYILCTEWEKHLVDFLTQDLRMCNIAVNFISRYLLVVGKPTSYKISGIKK